MSVWFVQLPILSANPKVIESHGLLVAKTNLAIQVLSAFGYRRVVSVDPTTREITISTRTFWLRRATQTIAFRDVQAIRYGVQQLPTSVGWVPGGAGVTDRLERFTVGVALHQGGPPIALCSFVGEGAVATGVGGALLGDEFLDWHGAQESASHAYADALRRFLQVPIRSALEDVARTWVAKELAACERCGRAIRRTAPRCVYCGSREPFRTRE